jgi:dienelactone hydrolase
VIIAHGCDGAQGKNYARWANQINQQGYNVVIVDSFTSRGYQKVCTQGYLVEPRLRAQDIDQQAQWIKQQSWHRGKIAVIGFSHGASTVLNIVNNPNIESIDSAIALYPGCGTKFVGRYISSPRRPTQVHLGDRDDWIERSIYIKTAAIQDCIETVKQSTLNGKNEFGTVLALIRTLVSHKIITIGTNGHIQ